MNIETKFNVKFDNALKEVIKRKLKKTLLTEVMKPMIENSKAFIRKGKVRPALEPSTIKQRKKMGITHKNPLYNYNSLFYHDYCILYINLN